MIRRASAATARRTGTVGTCVSFAHLDRARVRSEPFRARKFLDHRREASHARARHFLHADAFHEIGDGKAAARARHAARRQHVIRAAGVIAERLRAPIAEENAAGGVDAVEQAVSRRRAGSNAPARSDSRSARPPRDSARRAPRHFSRASAARDSFSASSASCRSISRGHVAAEARRSGDENRNRVGIVLGLRDQIGGDELRVAARRRKRSLRWARRACRSRNRRSRGALRR